MRKITIILLASSSLCLSVTPSLSQSSTATGTGIGVSRSDSTSKANSLAIGGGIATGGKATGGSSSVTLNSAAAPAATTSNLVTSGTTSVKTVPSVFAPALGAAGLETCLGSVSGGGSALGWGATFGTTLPDEGCQARLDARTLMSFGLKAAAVARLCQREQIWRSMPDICERYTPRVAARPVYASAEPVAVGNGRIELIDGKTGNPRWCDRYDAGRQKCRQWAVIP